jgi:hypothetical protein
LPEDEEGSPEVDAQPLPNLFEPLISALREVSAGMLEKDVDLRAIVGKLGEDSRIKELTGRDHLFQYLRDAQKQGVISLKIVGDVMWVRLTALTPAPTLELQQTVSPPSENQKHDSSSRVGERANDSNVGSSPQTVAVVGQNLTVSLESLEEVSLPRIPLLSFC